MGFKGGRSGSAWARVLHKKAQKIKTSTDLIVRTGERQIRDEFRKRDLPAKQVNKQDHPGGKAFRQNKPGNASVRTTTGNGFASFKLLVRSFWTAARTEAIKGILTYFGLVPMLFRSSLLIVRKKPRGVRARSAAGPAVRVQFRKVPRLAAWASREDKGSQYLRHIIFAKGKVLNSLVMEPTLKRSSERIVTLWKQAVVQNLRGSP